MGKTALLLLDVLNTFDFPGAEPLLAAASRAARNIAALIEQARAEDVAVVYVNDNFGRWHWERRQIAGHAAAAESKGRDVAAMLAPDEDDYFVVKPQFSGFYATTLSAVLPRLGVTRLILTGVAADICVLFTAADAHMREYDLWVPEDAVAGVTPERTGWALGIMRDAMGAETAPTSDLRLADWLTREDAP